MSHESISPKPRRKFPLIPILLLFAIGAGVMYWDQIAAFAQPILEPFIGGQ